VELMFLLSFMYMCFYSVLMSLVGVVLIVVVLLVLELVVVVVVLLLLVAAWRLAAVAFRDCVRGLSLSTLPDN
jgi:hypothetical protein